jgi:hypothetical protein
MSIAAQIAKIAHAEIGVMESPRNSNRGKRVDEYKAATWLDPKQSWPWCAAFVCWVVAQTGIKETATFKRPKTAGAWDFINWALDQDNTVRTLRNPTAADILPGDIVVFKFSHIGIAIVAGKDLVVTVEGNTDEEGSREGGGVYKKTRNVSQIKARIRFHA